MQLAAPRPVPRSETAPGRSDALEALVSLDGLALAEPYFDVSCRGEEVFRSTGSYYGCFCLSSSYQSFVATAPVVELAGSPINSSKYIYFMK